MVNGVYSKESHVVVILKIVKNILEAMADAQINVNQELVQNMKLRPLQIQYAPIISMVAYQVVMGVYKLLCHHALLIIIQI